MICRPLPSKVADWIQPRVKPARSGGWHVSTVLVAMLKETNPRKYQTWGKVREEERIPTDEVGYAWEDALAAPLAARALVPNDAVLMPPAELCVDDIYGTPDRPMFDLERVRFIVEEIKATWMSGISVLDVEKNFAPREQFQFESKFSYWRMQVKTYAAMIHKLVLADLAAPHAGPALPGKWWDVLFVDVPRLDPAATPLGRVSALFLNGCYRGELALPGRWELEWDRDELEAHWANVVAFAREHPELQSAAEGEPTV